MGGRRAWVRVREEKNKVHCSVHQHTPKEHSMQRWCCLYCRPPRSIEGHAHVLGPPVLQGRREAEDPLGEGAVVEKAILGIVRVAVVGNRQHKLLVVDSIT